MEEILQPMESRMTINPKGARIENLTIKGTEALTLVIRGDGKAGSSHPCTPIFGPETTTSYGLPQHGPMRNDDCKVEEQSPDKVVISDEINGGTYPKGLLVRQVFEIKNNVFSVETTHGNKGTENAPVNFCEHFYWNAPKGFEGLTINGIDVTGLVKNDGLVDALETNEIKIPGLPAIILSQNGFKFFNLWVYKDQDGKCDDNYVCIEPTEGKPDSDFFGSEESMIAPNASRLTRIIISCK